DRVRAFELEDQQRADEESREHEEDVDADEAAGREPVARRGNDELAEVHGQYQQHGEPADAFETRLVSESRGGPPETGRVARGASLSQDQGDHVPRGPKKRSGD